MSKHIIIGAGISGLTIAANLYNAVIFEKTNNIGGLSQSFRKDGFTFDCAGHYLHIPSEKEKVILPLLGCALKKHNKRTGIYMHEQYIDYPFQSNFHKLGREVSEQCIDGFMNRKTDIEPSNFREWVLKYYGEGIGNLFMFPYNRKVWQCAPEDMGFEWTGDFVPSLSEIEILEGSSHVNAYNSEFYYPSEPGFDNILPDIDINRIRLGEQIVSIDIKNKIIKTETEEIQYDKLISTMPLPELCRLCSMDVPDLQYSSCYNINLGVRGTAPHDYHWVYYPDESLQFYRVGIPSNVNRAVAPDGHYTLSLEIGYKGEFEEAGIINSLVSAGLLKNPEQIVLRKDVDIKYAYVIFNKTYRDRVGEILEELASYGIICTGRYGKWQYSFAAKDMEDALKLAVRLNHD